MSRSAIFGKRCLREMTRDPLGYIFCIGFPIIMLVIMSVINSSIPKEGMTLFRIDRLAPGIAIFGQTFVMLFTSLNVAHDRGGSFLVRMYATPMTSSDFVIGYFFPSMVISLAQIVVTYSASFVVSLITGDELSIAGMLASVLPLMISAVMFTSLGMIAGTLFSEKAAPGLCSIVISLSGMLGCIWFDAEKTGGAMLTVCKCLPFFYCTKAVRSAVALDFSFDSFVLPLTVITVCAAVFAVISSSVFRSKMRADLG